MGASLPGRTAEDITSQGSLLAGDKVSSEEAKNVVEQEAAKDKNVEKVAIEEAADNEVPEEEASENKVPQEVAEGPAEKEAHSKK